MKIATYNTWNSDMGMPVRLDQLVDEVIGAKAETFPREPTSLPATIMASWRS